MKQNINGLAQSAGFTALEMLVVMAMIGILAAISIPQYQRFVNKGNQQGVRLVLSATYMAEKSFAAENHTYTACLSSIGITGPANQSRSWYTYGFNGSTLQYSCGASANTTCNVSAWDNGVAQASCTLGSATPGTDWFQANITGDPAAVTTASLNQTSLGTVATDMSNTAFTARAVGNLSSGPGLDVWYIDQNGTPMNTLSNL